MVYKNRNFNDPKAGVLALGRGHKSVLEKNALSLKKSPLFPGMNQTNVMTKEGSTKIESFEQRSTGSRPDTSSNKFSHHIQHST